MNQVQLIGPPLPQQSNGLATDFRNAAAVSAAEITVSDTSRH